VSPDADSRQSDLAVMEAQEYTQKRLLRRLLDQRERVTEIATEARKRYVMGNVDERGRNTMLLYAVQDYISAGWTLLLSHAEATEAGTHSEYLFERNLGEMELLGDEIQFHGLYDLLTTDEIYVKEVTETVEYPQGPPQQVSSAESKAVPRDIAWAGCRLMDEFLAREHGVELKVDEMDDSLQTFGFSTIELEEAAANVETIDQIRDTIKSDIDARVLKNGDHEGDDGDEQEVEADA